MGFVVNDLRLEKVGNIFYGGDISIVINKVKLFLDAQDIRGLPLSTKELYIIIATGFCYSVIEDENRQQYYINNKYIDFETEN